MSNIDKRALREAAEKATPGPWDIARDGNTITSNQSHPVAVITEAFHRMLANGKTGCDAEFIAAANPYVMLSLLDELEAKDTRISEQADTIANQDKWISAIEEGMITSTDRAEAAEKRIAEFEVRAFNPALLDVISERQRQRAIEGWTSEHDDRYGESQLLWASSCYVLNTIQPFNRIPMDWPWAPEWWKPTNPRRDLVKAGALILAEIERIDRAAGTAKGE